MSLLRNQDDLTKRLDLIQAAIERHARTSFLLKRWSVTLVAAVFLLADRGCLLGVQREKGRPHRVLLPKREEQVLPRLVNRLRDSPRCMAVLTKSGSRK